MKRPHLIPAPSPERSAWKPRNGCTSWAEKSDRTTSVVVLRFAGLYGPGRVVRRKLVELGDPIPGDPDKLLNLIHIDDAASAAVAALSIPAPDPIYLVSDDRPVTRREYYSLIAKLLDAPPPRFVPRKPAAWLTVETRRASASPIIG